MNIFPVIMCGGAGTRLWPASRPSRPKQFLPLVGKRSLFQDAVTRVAGLVQDHSQIVVVAGCRHEELVRDQLAEIGVSAQVILEPEGRDSAPAMAAAALWTRSVDPSGVNVFVSSDHYLPDNDSFRRAALTAVGAATQGKIVTLGVKPTSPSSAYGYIKPAGEGLSDVVKFIEKPTVEKAVELVSEGLLWNTGIFVASCEKLLEQIEEHYSEIYQKVESSIRPGLATNPITLNGQFLTLPKISIDYAVMEKTKDAAVLPVSFDWSDLGSWDAVATKRNTNSNRHIVKNSKSSVVFAPDEKVVAIVGVENVAVVVENDAVLVCNLDHAQDVKSIVSLVSDVAPEATDFTASKRIDTLTRCNEFCGWIEQRALPIWAALGIEDGGVFSEEIRYDGGAVKSDHRLRVQARQLFVYVNAGANGWRGPWKNIVENGLLGLAKFKDPNSPNYNSYITSEYKTININATVYDTSFVIFALASVASAGINAQEHEALALGLLDVLSAKASDNGAIVEDGDHPFQSNAHMHLLEACLAWELVSKNKRWAEMSDRIVDLAKAIFIDPEDGALREFFTSDWKRSNTEYGKRVEPGHQFEWAWLLSNYAERRGSAEAESIARRLYGIGRKGFFAKTGVMSDAMNPEGTIHEDSARLWPQTEWLRAAIRFSRMSKGTERHQYLSDVRSALSALDLYLLPNGLWRDQMIGESRFAITNAKASSFYHIMGSYNELRLAIDDPEWSSLLK